ncbi:MAG: rhodanese-like domain-containing protein [Flavobacteriaceae bacterium]|nr:rhodanese-like domain-containing protein [Psychroflexus sp.]
MGLLGFLFGNKSKMIEEFKERQAIVIDVRSKTEFSGGAIPGSKNIPLQQIDSQIDQIKKMNKPVICCCASGMRSGNAASILKKNGIDCINGGGWSSLHNKLK